MKKLLVYALASLLALPAIDSEARSFAGEEKTKETVSSVNGKKKPKKIKTGKKKRKHLYRPGARQN